MLRLLAEEKMDRSFPKQLAMAPFLSGNIPGTGDRARHCWRNPETGLAESRRCQVVLIAPSQVRRLPAQPGLHPGRHGRIAIWWLPASGIRARLRGSPGLAPS